VTEIIYTSLEANTMLDGTSVYNTPGKFYNFLSGPMASIYAGSAFSGDDYTVSGDNFFNGLRLIEDISIRQVRVAGHSCGRTARILFDEEVCFDNSFILDSSKEEKEFQKTNSDWRKPDPLGFPGTSLYNTSRDAWLWTSATVSDESRFLGRYHLYPGSGFKTMLPRNGTQDFINYLEENYWVDPKTNVIFVSMVFYSSTLVHHYSPLRPHSCQFFTHNYPTTRSFLFISVITCPFCKKLVDNFSFQFFRMFS